MPGRRGWSLQAAGEGLNRGWEERRGGRGGERRRVKGVRGGRGEERMRGEWRGGEGSEGESWSAYLTNFFVICSSISIVGGKKDNRKGQGVVDSECNSESSAVTRWMQKGREGERTQRGDGGGRRGCVICTVQTDELMLRRVPLLHTFQSRASCCNCSYLLSCLIHFHFLSHWFLSFALGLYHCRFIYSSPSLLVLSDV